VHSYTHADDGDESWREEGGRRVKIQPTDGSSIRPVSWYVIPLFPNLVRLIINSCRIMGNRIWKKNESVKEESRPSCDPGLEKIVEMLVKSWGRKLSWEGLEPRTGEVYTMAKARNKFKQSVTIATPIGNYGRDPKDNKDVPRNATTRS